MYQRFNDYGRYSDSCHNEARQKLEKIEIASLGFKLLQQTELDSHHKKIYVYTKFSKDTQKGSFDFAHKVTRHTGFGERTTIYVSKNSKRSEIDLGDSDGSEFLDYLFKDQTFVQVISRGTPRLQLSEFYIYFRKP